MTRTKSNLNMVIGRCQAKGYIFMLRRLPLVVNTNHHRSFLLTEHAVNVANLGLNDNEIRCAYNVVPFSIRSALNYLMPRTLVLLMPTSLAVLELNNEAEPQSTSQGRPRLNLLAHGHSAWFPQLSYYLLSLRPSCNDISPPKDLKLKILD